MRELGGDANCVTDLQTDTRTQPFIVKDYCRVTGGEDGNCDSEDILEYRDGDGWRKVGAMRHARAYSGVSIIKYEDFKDYCY